MSAKQITVAGRTLFVRGATYGTFRAGPDGSLFPAPSDVALDFAAMAAHGINTVRTYTTPPGWLLDLAQEHGLYVMAGVAWPQHLTFLDRPDLVREIEATVRGGVRACAGHPALLCHVVGNEIPTAIVRWHGARAIEQFLTRLVQIARSEDPGGLVTYANYPSSEYLSLPSLDLYAMNLFLERRCDFEAYLARLQHLAGERPLLVSESGLDAASHGESEQARAVDWQIRSAFAGGCAGIVLFAWTDEWHRDGRDVTEWAFGLTDAQRRARPALRAASEAFAATSFCMAPTPHRVSVVVCTHNGSRTIRACLEGIRQLDYPDFETIVVDDGSTDGAGLLAERFGFRVIRTEHRGLSSARNTGLAAATGEIVAYIDDDAFPHPDWLSYLVLTFRQGDYVAVGGPNIPPPNHGVVADAVAVAPGGPSHVMLDDREAEHLPGCNLAIRRSALEAIGGFDSRFRAAGDDVDVCWRLQQAGGRLGFSPGAVVWHHRRDTVRGYWRQQVGYGYAEALLSEKWPERYNHFGQATWLGRLYGATTAVPLLPFRSDRVHFGRWGGAAFQPAERLSSSLCDVLPLTPNWYASIVLLLIGTVISAAWPRLAVAAGGLALAAAMLTAIQAGRLARHGLRERGMTRPGWRRFVLSTMLVVLQPLARLHGRTRRREVPGPGSGVVLPGARTTEWTSTDWAPLDGRLTEVDVRARCHGARVQAGTPGDRWDLQVDGGLLGSARLRTTVEEHGHGVQVMRARTWPRLHVSVVVTATVLLAAAVGAALETGWAGALTFATCAAALVGRSAFEAGRAQAILLKSVSGVAGSADADGAPSIEDAGSAMESRPDLAAARLLPEAGPAGRSLAGAASLGLTGVGHNGVARGGVARVVRPLTSTSPLQSSALAPRTPSTPDQ